MLAEIGNYAIEAAVDYFFDEEHRLLGAAKNMGSAAVVFVLTIAMTVWGLVFFY